MAFQPLYLSTVITGITVTADHGLVTGCSHYVTGTSLVNLNGFRFHVSRAVLDRHY